VSQVHKHRLITYSAAKQKFATVLVEESEERFVVHESLLTHHSEVFRRELSGTSRKAEDKMVKVFDTEPYIFECFVHWLYYQRFPDISKGDDEELAQIWGTLGGDHKIMENLIKMYVLGDRFIVPQLQRDTLAHLFRHIDYEDTTTPSISVVTYAFDRLHPNNPLCRFLVDVSLRYDWNSPEDGTPYDLGNDPNWPIAYLLSFAHQATKVIGDIRFRGKHIFDFDLDLCDYHEHKTPEDRKKCDDKQVETP
jgi:hypothetical protein